MMDLGAELTSLASANSHPSRTFDQQHTIDDDDYAMKFHGYQMI